MTTGVYFTPCGHGHVVPNPDGSRADCGGPTSCLTCATEQDKINKGEMPDTQQAQMRLQQAAEQDIGTVDDLHADDEFSCPHCEDLRGSAVDAVLRLYDVQERAMGGVAASQFTLNSLLADARRIEAYLRGGDD